MNTFTAREAKLIAKLRQAPEQATLELREACPTHSACTPFPLFRVHRVGEEDFEAEWNTHHRKGPKQLFRFDTVLE